MVRGAAMLDVLDELGLGAQLMYADRSTHDNRSWASFAVSGQERGNLAGDEVEMIQV